MKKVDFKVLHSFTTTPYKGNPAGLVMDAAGLSGEEMQLIASELKCSETAFVLPSDDADFRLRFFSPQREVELCGHATIATFVALVDQGKISLEGGSSTLTQETMVGVLEVEVEKDSGGQVRALMHQNRPEFRSTGIGRKELAEALGLSEDDIRDDLPCEIVSTGIPSFHIPIKGLKAMAEMKPDPQAVLKTCNSVGCGALFPFSMETSSPETIVHVRCFAQPYGVFEDPVTGTANGAMGCYLMKHGLLKEQEYQSEQGIEMGKGGRVLVRIIGKPDNIINVLVGGTAVEVISGSIRL